MGASPNHLQISTRTALEVGPKTEACSLTMPTHSPRCSLRSSGNRRWKAAYCFSNCGSEGNLGGKGAGSVNASNFWYSAYGTIAATGSPFLRMMMVSRPTDSSSGSTVYGAFTSRSVCLVMAHLAKWIILLSDFRLQRRRHTHDRSRSQTSQEAIPDGRGHRERPRRGEPGGQQGRVRRHHGAVGGGQVHAPAPAGGAGRPQRRGDHPRGSAALQAERQRDHGRAPPQGRVHLPVL